MKYIFILLLLLSTACQHRYAYRNETTYIMDTIIVSKEKFDTAFFFANADELLDYRNTLEDGTLIKMTAGREEFVEWISPSDSYYANVKIFYRPSGVIKEEGKAFVKGGWCSGIWKFYHTNGRLVKTIDYDGPFKFTIDDVLKYCKKNGWEIGKGHFAHSDVDIRREVFEGKGTWALWVPRVEHEIYLDGDTGKETGRKYMPLVY
ncbi:hypothetical protein [Bacteroides sp. 224]|uniref:hypothetical protein n=1 Tax=Bacteroides sp. 224 TaxID=2302936 RepID=UPI0013D54FA5|nr:hypothetical protein [Bacteroides sp. 224]NDV65074.1 hypothetical protein [Bacteroides sp. 224]